MTEASSTKSSSAPPPPKRNRFTAETTAGAMTRPGDASTVTTAVHTMGKKSEVVNPGLGTSLGNHDHEQPARDRA
ncbi:protein of unknown function [Agreia sp. COWG]|nr:protein of unknown function [Agreia sp. COWG]